MSLRNYLRMNMSRRRQQVFSHGARHSRPANNQHAESLRSSTGPERYPHGGNGRGNAYTRRPNRRHSPTRFSHSHSASSVNTHAQANPQYRSNDYRRRNRRQNQTQSHDRNSALFHLQSQNALQHQYLNVTSNSPSQNLRSSKPSYLPHQICREDLIPNRFECEDQMSFVPPTGPRIWRQPSRRIQEPLLPSPSPRLQYFGQPQLIENEHDIDMTDATEETTDIEMTDAPPIWCDGAQTWINEPTKIVAEGLASVNAVLTRLEWYVRTGNMPVGIVPSTQASLF